MLNERDDDMELDADIEEQVRKHIVEYRSQGYSDEQMKEALLKSNVDPLTVSQLLSSTKNPSKPFHTRWWFVLPFVFFSFFVFLFIVFILFFD